MQYFPRLILQLFYFFFYSHDKQHLSLPKRRCSHRWLAKPGQKRTMNSTTLGLRRSQPPPRIARDSECLLMRQRSSFIITIHATLNTLIESISGNIKFPHAINISYRVIWENTVVLCYRINQPFPSLQGWGCSTGGQCRGWYGTGQMSYSALPDEQMLMR